MADIEHTQIAGLQVLVSETVEASTLHVITPPPVRVDYASDADYERAYVKWERIGLWTVKGLS